MPFLKEGMDVLDVGCGTGAITRGIAERVRTGRIVGIDVSKDLVSQGKENHKDIRNLTLEVQDIFEYPPSEKFDLVTSSRTLQWLSNPEEALIKMKELLKPGGMISILDYNHEKIEWSPALPQSMQRFYTAFLDWRSDAGMNNRIADDLPSIFESLKLKNILVADAGELSLKGDPDFYQNASIWSKVAETRGQQMVQDHYITEDERLQAIGDYNEWIVQRAFSMKLYLLQVSGYFEI